MDRISVGRIVFGHGPDRKIIEPGTRFDIKTLGISEEDARKMEARGIIRKPRDDTTRPAVGDVAATEPAAVLMNKPAEEPAEAVKEETPASRRKASLDSDEL